MLHEAYARQVLERDLRVELSRSREEVMAELSRARGEMQAIQHHLLTGPDGPAALDRVQDEVRVLQDLVSRLTGRRAGHAPAGGSRRDRGTVAQAAYHFDQ